MKEQLISFETAKLAKDKGFNWESLFIYYSDYRVEAGKLSQQSFKHDWNNGGDMYNSAPTQSLLQRWLREKHNIDIQLIKLNDKWCDRHIKTNLFESYEEALETVLFEGLKLIEID